MVLNFMNIICNSNCAAVTYNVKADKVICIFRYSYVLYYYVYN